MWRRAARPALDQQQHSTWRGRRHRRASDDRTGYWVHSSHAGPRDAAYAKSGPSALRPPPPRGRSRGRAYPLLYPNRPVAGTVPAMAPHRLGAWEDGPSPIQVLLAGSKYSLAWDAVLLAGSGELMRPERRSVRQSAVSRLGHVWPMRVAWSLDPPALPVGPAVLLCQLLALSLPPSLFEGGRCSERMELRRCRSGQLSWLSTRTTASGTTTWLLLSPPLPGLLPRPLPWVSGVIMGAAAWGAGLTAAGGTDPAEHWSRLRVLCMNQGSRAPAPLHCRSVPDDGEEEELVPAVAAGVLASAANSACCVVGCCCCGCCSGGSHPAPSAIAVSSSHV